MKVFVVSCDSCGEKQIWGEERVVNGCNSCESTLVKKTISGEDLTRVKQLSPDTAITYSDYQVYSIFPEDVERIRAENRAAKKAAFQKKGFKKKNRLFSRR